MMSVMHTYIHTVKQAHKHCTQKYNHTERHAPISRAPHPHNQKHTHTYMHTYIHAYMSKRLTHKHVYINTHIHT